MTGERVERRLAAIFAADVVGYSWLMGEDEDGTLSRLKALRRELIDPMITEHKGRIVKTTGDGLLVEFPSVVGAVHCAVEVQRGITERNVSVAEERRIEFRIGIHQGDVIAENGDIFGDGVNIAARLEGLAEPGGICVSDRVQSDAVGKVDIGFDDLGPQQVKNIARPVHVYRVRLDKSSMTRSLALPDKPSIAVLPFQNMSGDPEQEYFADGMVEEIITALSRIRWLFVIARNSSFTYKGQAVDIKRVGRELGVRYVLEGSVRKGGNRVRITAQLNEAETGAHLWADHFDGALEDVFDLQDKVASSVAGVIEPTVQVAETARSAARPTNDLTAYDLYLRAFALLFSSTRHIPEALHLLEQAIARDPRYGRALGLAGVCCFRLLLDDKSNDPAADRAKATEFARRALELASDDPGILVDAALTLAYCDGNIDAMIALINRALSLNPNYARGWTVSGILRVWAGQPDAAIEHAETALRLSPRERVSTPVTVIGCGHFMARRFEEAVPKLLLAIEEDRFPTPYRYLAACYAHMGRLAEAQEIVAQLRRITPHVMPLNPSHGVLRKPEHRELLFSGLRLAMGEAG